MGDTMAEQPLVVNEEGVPLQEWEKTKILAFLKTTSEEVSKSYIPLRRRWYVTQAYLRGLQFTTPFATTVNTGMAIDYLTMANSTNDVDEERFIDNLILPRYMKLLARLSKYQPSISVWPNSLSQQDQEACRMARVLCYDTIEKSNFTKMKVEIARYLLEVGNYAIRTTWNPRAGAIIEVPTGEIRQVKVPKGQLPDGTPIEAIREEQVTEKRPCGEIEIKITNPRKLTVSRRSRSKDDLDWVEERNVMTVDAIYRDYGVVVASESISIEDEEFSDPYYSNTGKENPDDNSGGSLTSALVRERWIRPCIQFPKGAHIVWTQKELLRCTDLLSLYDDIPFEFGQMLPKDDSFWGDTPLYHVLPHQDEINRLETEIMRHTKLVCKPKLLSFMNCRIPEGKWDDSTGEEIQLNGEKGNAPFWLMAPELPQAIYQNIEKVLQSMDDIISVHDVGVRSSISGSTVATLQEQDESNFSPVFDMIGENWNRALAQALKIAADYITAPRMIRMTNRDTMSVEEFKGSMLNGNFSVHCEIMSGLPANKIARQQVIFQALDKGVINAQQAGAYLEFGEFEEMMREVNEDKQVAEINTRTIIQGDGKILAPVHEWDNHQVYIQTIESYMKRYYDSWSIPLRNVLNEKLMLHKQWVSAATMPGMPGEGMPTGAISAQNAGQMAGTGPEQQQAPGAALGQVGEAADGGAMLSPAQQAASSAQPQGGPQLQGNSLQNS